jgi:PAS domain S-box-containing protein
MNPDAGNDASGSPMIGATSDQTARRRAEALRAGELKILRMIASGARLPDVLDALVRTIEDQADGMLGSILLLEDNVRVRHGAAPNLPAAYVNAIDGEEIGPARGSCGTALYRRETVIVEDIATDPLWEPYRELALGHGLRACWSVPIQPEGRPVLGSFALYYSKPRFPTPDLLALTQHATYLAAIAIEHSRREVALIDSEAFTQSILDNALDANVIMDDGGLVIAWSVRAVEMFGWTAAEAVGRTLADLIIPERFRALHTQGLARYRQTGQGPVLNQRLEVSALHRNGHEFPVELAVSPIRRAGRVIFSAFIADITTRKRMEEELRQLQKLDAIGRLTGGVAHDFNNLLTVILGYGELLLDEVENEPRLRADVEEIVNAGKRASGLTRQLLAFARKQALQPQKLDLNAVVGGMERMLRRLIRENIAITTHLAPDLWPVMADPGQIEQVIINLAVNAQDAIVEAGQVTFESANVEIDEEQARNHAGVTPGPHVMLAITDTGSGIDEETRRKIFEPFFTTKELGKGTGLGLATVYGIVKQSGGHIWLYSEPGRGTTFKIFLPRSVDDAEEPLVRAVPDAHLSGGEHILLVEDEPALRTLCERMLRGLKYNLTIAADGEEAAAIVEQQGLKPDLILTDLIMTGMTGMQLAERLRRDQPHLKVLFMSGHTDKTIQDQGFLSPGTPLLEKPFTVATLAAAVRHALIQPA